MGAGRGEFIDRHKYVIRFFYWGDWQKPEDYGVRTSYYFSNNNRFNKKFTRKLPEVGYIIYNKNGRELAKEYKYIMEKFGGGDFTERLKYAQREYLKDSAHPYFSHGSAAIIWAIMFLGISVTAFGCDAVNMMTPENYIGSAHYEGRKTKVGHDYRTEGEAVREFARKKNVKLRFE
jgi:hypothetical protein